MEDHDRDVIAEANAKLLQDAYSLTNGHADDRKKIGEVLYGLANEIVDIGGMVRSLVEDQEKFQTQEACLFNHQGKLAKVSIFGIAYRAPLAVCLAIVGVYGILSWLISKGVIG